MTSSNMEHYDLLVIGSGPAGQQAAIGASRGGLRVAVCEQLREVGGACVHHGTIPSKALRERALARMGSRAPDQGVSVAALIGEVSDVIHSHDRYMAEQLRRHGVDVLHGRASFVTPGCVRLRSVAGRDRDLEADYVVIATGSVPRRVPAVPVDHEHVFDSDSILTLAYLPRSMTVLGGGVVACEYASIFALLGVQVTQVDRAPEPLGFLDDALRQRYLDGFAALGGQFLGGATVAGVAFDGIASVETELESGARLYADKVLCALGRVSRVSGLQLDRAGIGLNERGLIAVNRHGQTVVPHIYAAGDVIGPPALASASMEQGRRAACHLLGLDVTVGVGETPTGIYTVPALACVGETERHAREAHPGVVVGEVRFSEVARAHIAGTQDGYLKLVVSGDRRIRGVHAAGAEAAELVHMGQMALIHGAAVDVFIDNVFNFPTYGEAFRLAALDAAYRLGAGAAETGRPSAVPLREVHPHATQTPRRGEQYPSAG